MFCGEFRFVKYVQVGTGTGRYSADVSKVNVYRCVIY